MFNVEGLGDDKNFSNYKRQRYKKKKEKSEIEIFQRYISWYYFSEIEGGKRKKKAKQKEEKKVINWLWINN